MTSDNTDSAFPPARIAELKRLVARGPLYTRMVNWVVSQLDMDTTDERHPADLWQTHWRARSLGPIHAFLLGNGEGDDAFVASVKSWTGGAVNPHRILKLNATEWTPLERRFVAHWAVVHHTRKQIGIAWNRGVPQQEIEDVIQDFWTQVFHSADSGPLRGYEYEPTGPLSPEDQFRVYLNTCFVRHCIKRAVELAKQRDRSEEFDETRFSTTPTDSRTGISTRGDPRPIESQLLELIDACIPKLTAMEKLVLEMHLQGHNAKHIARSRATTEGAVRVRLHRAKRKLVAFGAKDFVGAPSVGHKAGNRP